MPQLHLYVSDDVAAEIRRRAQAAGVSVSKYLARLVSERTSHAWPAGWFEHIAGGWCGDPLERPAQGAFETRQDLR